MIDFCCQTRTSCRIIEVPTTPTPLFLCEGNSSSVLKGGGAGGLKNLVSDYNSPSYICMQKYPPPPSSIFTLPLSSYFIYPILIVFTKITLKMFASEHEKIHLPPHPNLNGLLSCPFTTYSTCICPHVPTIFTDWNLCKHCWLAPINNAITWHIFTKRPTFHPISHLVMLLCTFQ